MAVNLIVLAVTLLVAGFVAVWICVPRLRPWMELPKHRFLDRQRRFPTVARAADPADVVQAVCLQINAAAEPPGSRG